MCDLYLSIGPVSWGSLEIMATATGHRRGFSLAEVVVGSGVLAMFMVGLPIAVRMARTGVPDGNNTPSATMDAGRVTEMMQSDLSFATSVNSSAQYDPNHITFTVPDRNGDGLQETIAYACAPAPPPAKPGVRWLTRTYNGTSLTLLSNVREFNLTYDTLAIAAPPGTNQGGSVLLASIALGSATPRSL